MALAVIRLTYFILILIWTSALIAFLSELVHLPASIVSAENIQMFKKLLKYVDFSYTMFRKALY